MQQIRIDRSLVPTEWLACVVTHPLACDHTRHIAALLALRSELHGNPVSLGYNSSFDIKALQVAMFGQASPAGAARVDEELTRLQRIGCLEVEKVLSPAGLTSLSVTLVRPTGVSK